MATAQPSFSFELARRRIFLRYWVANTPRILTTVPVCHATVLGVTILKQAVFSIVFAVAAVAIAEFTVGLLEQNGWVNP
jgi:hypothetical protein